MLFSSLTFLYFFLPLTVLLYYIIPSRVWKNSLLLIASLLFYSWGEPVYLILMILSSLIAYIYGLIYDKIRLNRKLCKINMLICTALLLSSLIVFKYFGFLTDNISFILGKSINTISIPLPIGISFFTFQILSYVIDLYRGEIGVQKNFFYFTLYVSFFPQLIAGPIVRYQTVEQEINTRHENLEDFLLGFRRFIVGLAKKVLIANNVAKISELVYANENSGTSALWLAAICYTFQIYFDFSGYSDMAIGLGKMFGFHFLENFNYPYISTSITDFWRRWHISLSTWFRDYVYIPLGGNRVKKSRWYLNIFIVWGLTGFWHGASWNFVLWGLYYAIILVIEKQVLLKVFKRIPSFITWVYTIFLVIIGWVIFNITDFSQMLSVLKTMFTYSPTNWQSIVNANITSLTATLYIPFAFIFSFPLAKKIKIPENNIITSVFVNLIYALIFALCIIYIASSSYNPFIYFRF